MNRRGLTLVEVIISALVLAITVAGILYVFSTEKGVVARTGRNIQAINFGRQTLEELKNAVNAETWPNSGRLGVALTDAVLPGGAFRDKFKAARSYEVTNIGLSTTNPNYKQVKVKVEWEEPAGKEE